MKDTPVDRQTPRQRLKQSLDPRHYLDAVECKLFGLALLEELKGLPFGVVWDYYCWQQDVPIGITFMDEMRTNFASLYQDKLMALQSIYYRAEVKGVKTEIEDRMVATMSLAERPSPKHKKVIRSLHCWT